MTNEGMDEQSDRRAGTGNLLSLEERAECQRLMAGEPPHNQRAQALMALDEGATQEVAGQHAGLSKGQVRYWLAKFRKVGMAIFPEAASARVEPQPEPLPPEVKPPAKDDPAHKLEAAPDNPQNAEILDEEMLAKTPDKESAKIRSPQKKTKKGKKTKKTAEDKGGDIPPNKKKDGKGNDGKKSKKKKPQPVKSGKKKKKKSKKTKGSKKGKKKKDSRARQGKKNKKKS